MLVLIFIMYNLALVDERYMFLKIEKIDLMDSFLINIIDDIFRIRSFAESIIGFTLFPISLIIIWKFRMKVKLLIDLIIKKI